MITHACMYASIHGLTQDITHEITILDFILKN